jgi:uncharacterized protein YmfQ (DUF2313 family)
MSDRHIRRFGDDYAQQLLALLPTGQAWPRDPGSTLVRGIMGLAQYYGFVDGRAADLLERESDPRQTIELLTDWERNWGLPDPCVAEPLTIGDRRTALMQKMTLLGAQSRQFFIDVAKQLGYDITISEYAPFMAGVSNVGETRPLDEIAATTPPATWTPFNYFDWTANSYNGSTDPGPGKFGFNQAIAGDPGYPPFQGSLGAVAQHLVVGSNTDANGQAVPVGWFALNNNGLPNFKKYLIVRDKTTPGNFVTFELLQPVVNPTWSQAQFKIIDAGGQAFFNDGHPVEYKQLWDQPGHYRWEIGPPEMRFTWTIHVKNARLVWFRCSAGQAGVDPHLLIGRATDLECRLNGPHGWKPAHTLIVFDYSGMQFDDPMAGTP